MVCRDSKLEKRRIVPCLVFCPPLHQSRESTPDAWRADQGRSSCVRRPELVGRWNQGKGHNQEVRTKDQETETETIYEIEEAKAKTKRDRNQERIEIETKSACTQAL